MKHAKPKKQVGWSVPLAISLVCALAVVGVGRYMALKEQSSPTTTTVATTTTTTTLPTTTTTKVTTTTALRGTTTAPPIVSVPVNHYRGEKPLKAVPMILQNPELPTGCECTAITMLLQAYGYDVTKQDVAKLLPRSGFSYENGRTYGPHPNDAFLGDPFTQAGYGIFAGLASRIAQTVIDGADGYHVATDVTGAGQQEILSYLDKGIPVCIWATMGMVPLRDAGGWYIKKDGVFTDEWFTWPGNEHCLVLTKYDASTVTVHDPMKGVKTYDRATFFTRYKDVGSQAMVLKLKK